MGRENGRERQSERQRRGGGREREHRGEGERGHRGEGERGHRREGENERRNKTLSLQKNGGGARADGTVFKGTFASA